MTCTALPWTVQAASACYAGQQVARPSCSAAAGPAPLCVITRWNRAGAWERCVAAAARRHWCPRGARAARCRRCHTPRASGAASSPQQPARRPSLQLSAEDTFAAQWQALQRNDEPAPDAGVETLYAFALIDLFLARSTYFGQGQADLGQFERFRRVLHSPRYRVLLSHLERTVLSTLFVNDDECRQRVRIRGYRGTESGEFTMTLKRALGGRTDGVWLTTRLTCDQYWSSGPDDDAAEDTTP